MWKWEVIEKLAEARRGEKVVAFYNSPTKNIEGTKFDEKIIAAERDAIRGKCSLMVFREFKDNYGDLPPTAHIKPDFMQSITDEATTKPLRVWVVEKAYTSLTIVADNLEIAGNGYPVEMDSIFYREKDARKRQEELLNENAHEVEAYGCDPIDVMVSEWEVK